MGTYNGRVRACPPGLYERWGMGHAGPMAAQCMYGPLVNGVGEWESFPCRKSAHPLCKLSLGANRMALHGAGLRRRDGVASLPCGQSQARDSHAPRWQVAF